MYTDVIHTLQIDLISTCNARCPSCFRQNSQGLPQPHYPKNVHLNLDLYEKALRDPALKDLKEVLLCGNFGDALASSQLLEMIDRTDQVNPELGFYVHTNGGLGSKVLWSELAQRLNGRGRFVKFAIDGLEDTNSIYRRGVSWKQLMQNASQFISEGGRAVWKFVVFEHNKHQINEARALSEEMGFVRFETTKNYSNYGEPFQKEDLSQRPEYKEDDFSIFSEETSAQNLRPAVQISCDVKKEKILFMDFDGFVWPCCWIAAWKYSANTAFRNKHQEYFDEVAQENFNSLSKNTLSEILSHKWFKEDLETSWQSPERKAQHPLCKEKCGVC